MTATVPDRQLARLSGHSGPIHALSWSSGNAQYILSGSSDRTINLYNPSKAIAEPSSPKTLVQSFSGVHAYEVLSIAVAFDNSRFASGGGDKSVFLWDVHTAQVLRRYGSAIGGHSGRIECVAFGGEGDSVVVSGSYDSSVRLWDTKSQSSKPIMVLDEAKDSVTTVDVSEHEVMTGSVDGRLRVYDLRMGMAYVDVIGHSCLVSTLDSKLRLMDKSNGKLLQSYEDPSFTNDKYRIRSSPGGRDTFIVSGSEDGYVYAWDVVSGERIKRVRHHTDQVSSKVRGKSSVVSAVTCKRKGEEWASAGGDGTVVIWGR
ncbi:MAG: hypothetical protein M1831_001237 [Alyxoria varia]|nr:MAG: hypothetical protein M1831_001237 [Alyxoria varia]